MGIVKPCTDADHGKTTIPALIQGQSSIEECFYEGMLPCVLFWSFHMRLCESFREHICTF